MLQPWLAARYPPPPPLPRTDPHTYTHTESRPWIVYSPGIHISSNNTASLGQIRAQDASLHNPPSSPTSVPVVFVFLVGLKGYANLMFICYLWIVKRSHGDNGDSHQFKHKRHIYKLGCVTLFYPFHYKSTRMILIIWLSLLSSSIYLCNSTNEARQYASFYHRTIVNSPIDIRTLKKSNDNNTCNHYD